MEKGDTKTELNEEIQHISLHNPRNRLLHGYIFPYIFFHLGWLYIWLNNFGYNDYFEVGMIGFVVVGLLQILTTLFCLWFVHVQVLMTCSTVSEILYKYISYKYLCYSLTLCIAMSYIDSMWQYLGRTKKK